MLVSLSVQFCCLSISLVTEVQSALTGVLRMPWLLGPTGVEFSDDVDSCRVRGLWREECMLANVGQGLAESRKSFGDAGGPE